MKKATKKEVREGVEWLNANMGWDEKKTFADLTDVEIIEMCAGVMGWCKEKGNYIWWFKREEEKNTLTAVELIRKYNPLTNPAQTLDLAVESGLDFRIDYYQYHKKFWVKMPKDCQSNKLDVCKADDQFGRAVCEAVLKAKGLVK